MLVLAWPCAPALAAQSAQSRTASMAINLPLKFAGIYQGDITAEVSSSGEVALDVQRFITLLGPRITADASATLRASATQAGAAPLGAFQTIGIVVEYDPTTLEIAVSIPVEKQGAQRLALQESGQRELPKPTILEAPVAATAILRGQRRYRWATGDGVSELEPVEVAADIAANFGGADGVHVFSQIGFRGGRGTGFERGNLLFVHDDLRRAIRYSGGDVAPQSAGFQTAPLIGGLSVERQFGTIQPFRNVRPSGQFSFILDRAASVDVVVNGAVLRTLRLDAGQYSLADFPFFNGLNQVELYVVDGAGRRLLTSFSQYFSARLLDPGIFEFGAAAGVLQSQESGSGPGKSERYLRDQPAFSGYVRRGITSNLTAGANLQAGRQQFMAGLEAAVATPVGTIGVLASMSHHPTLGRGRAALFSYEGSAQKLGFLTRPQVNFELQTIGRGFAPLQLTTPVNRYRMTMQARLATQLPGQFSFGVSTARFVGRDSEPDQTRYAATVGRRFGPMNLTAAYEKVVSTGPQRQQYLLLTLAAPFGRTSAIRSTYDTRGRLGSVEFSRFQADEIDSVGMRLALSRGKSGFNGAGELSYNHNRFSTIIQHSLIAEPNLGRIRGQETSLSVATQVAFADGQFAFGRPVGPRFAIVSAHPTLADSVVAIRQGSGRDKPQARTGFFGPALAPAGNAYSASEVRIDVEDAPVGYDIGDSQYTTVPGPAAGYSIMVGSDDSRMLLGIAVDAAGAPLALLGGTLRLLGKDEVEPVLVFTNRAGRFAGNGLRPGTYELILGTEQRFVGELVIPQKADGVVEVGTVTLQKEIR